MATSASQSPSSPRPATSADVAKRAGVSRATVSYILNDKPGHTFTPETRAAVLQAAHDLAYQPNIAARSLVGGAGPIVMVMSHLPHNEMTSAAVATMSREFAARGVLTTVLQVSNDLDSSVEAITALNPRAAILAFPAAGELGDRIRQAGVEVIGFTQEDGEFSTSRIQVTTLAERGHTRLAFADVVDSGSFGVLPRRAEFAEACTERGLDGSLAAEFARDGVGAADIIAGWHRDGVTGVCAYNDEIALAVLFGIREAGLSCPGDIAVIGCDDIPAAAVAYPPLTTVGFDVNGGSSWIASEVLHRLGLAAEPEPPAGAVFTIVERDSA